LNAGRVGAFLTLSRMGWLEYRESRRVLDVVMDGLARMGWIGESDRLNGYKIVFRFCVLKQAGDEIEKVTRVVP
jgi:hypothetical protein